MQIISQRKVNRAFDLQPALHHIYNYETSLPYIKNKRVLDAGCWSGQYAQLASQAAKKVYGFDPDPAAIKMAQKKIPQGSFKIGSVLKIPFSSNFFDLVMFSEVIEHIPAGTEEQALKEIHRVLKPGGILILTTPRDHPISILLDPAFFLIGHRHYSEKTIRSLLTHYKFKIRKLYFTRGLVNLLTANLESLFKFTINKKPNYPKFVHKLLKKELTSSGFTSIYVIAEKKG